MSSNESARFVELVGAGSLEQAFEAKVRARRWGVFLVTAGLAIVGLWLLADIYQASGWTPLRALSLGLFAVLFTTLAFGFTQAFLGFLALADGHEPLKITNTLDPHTPLASTAVVMPVYNEDPATVFGNIRALYESLRQRGELEAFEFYVLSDSTDPDRLVDEELAWADLCRQSNGFGRVHYRRRTLPVNRKSGNIADFCRRWGHRHRYMIVLDADSVMTGEAVASLVRLMEVNARAGIIQTMPRLVKADTLFGRVQQFAARVYSPIFAAGLNFWQQGSGNYWGHNAIIRVSPFLTNCGLPELPGAEPLGGRILSHDFVEAALMRANGWEVWFAHDLEGSYEGLPPNLSEYVKRDRRWCQGNLQHAWFLLARGIHGLSRLHLVQGILAYVSAPLLALFILLGGLQAAVDRWHRLPAMVPSASGIVLFLLTLALLFGPKGLSLLHLFSRPAELHLYGGRGRLVAGAMVETLFSILTAPVMLWFHTRFVWRNLAGQTISWHTQTREGGNGPRWRGVLAEYWPLPVAGTMFGLLAWLIDPAYAAWLLPILAGLWLAVPVAQLGGRKGLGQALFWTPEETEPSAELLHEFRPTLRAADGFVHAILHPYGNAVHVSLQRGGVEGVYASGLAMKLFREGPEVLNTREKRSFLADGTAVARLHALIWKTPAALMHPAWSQAIQGYRARPPFFVPDDAREKPAPHARLAA
ncbi:MAG TPA: glucans biosynthesis glucosyltransferase MdoH [Chthoniobacterales bacterium]